MYDFLIQDAPTVARQLIGYEMVVEDEQGIRGGIITETEAYTATDPASHSYKGQTIRNGAMFMSAGTIYIYKIYGIHYCFNLVCGASDGQAVLIRGLSPTIGTEFMRTNRHINKIIKLCNGPAKLVEALGLKPELNKSRLIDSSIKFIAPVNKPEVKVTPRIGITKGVETLWRFQLQHIAANGL